MSDSAEPGSSDSSAHPEKATALLARISAGDASAADELLPLVYGDLRARAAAYLRRQRANHTLQPTALVHEAYVKLIGARNKTWAGRTHFYAVAATAMRQLLIDHARRRARSRRAHEARVDLARTAFTGQGLMIDLLALDEALATLGKIDVRRTRIVELRFFGGLTNSEVAGVLGVSVSTVEKEWRSVRAWLFDQLDGENTT